jgi:hypothetical protein
MSTSSLVISPDEMRAALVRLGALALADGVDLHLRITGGTVMMLEFKTRVRGTRDCDVLSAQPSEKLPEYARIIAVEKGWPEKWLNKNASKFERDAKAPDDAETHEVFRCPGLLVTRPSTVRLLAWKLARYADSVDQADALDLLRSILSSTPYSRESLALQLDAHLSEIEVKRAIENLEDLWEALP